MRHSRLFVFLLVTLTAVPAFAFLEDLCLPRNKSDGKLSWCVRPKCPTEQRPNRACPAQTADFITIKPGRSMIHADSTYFLAQALGYRADVAYWLAAYNEVTDYGLYNPIDQCGVQASKGNSGAGYMAAAFDGFKRTNRKTDGPLDHYVVSFSPNGQGTDVHGAGGVQGIYPLYYPRLGYPEHIDTTYQKTLANLRQWAMLKTNDPGLLCTVGLVDATGTACVENLTIKGTVPAFVPTNFGVKLSIATGRKVLDSSNGIVYYEELGNWLRESARTSGTLWLDPATQPVPVPVQVARMGVYLHVMQDSCSHATYCGDDAPTPPGGGDPGTYMYIAGSTVNLSFGGSCANSPHLASHVQETGTGDNALPLRDYTALNMTLDELVLFGNWVALPNGWIANPELLPPDIVGGRNAQGASAADLKNALVGTITGGTPAYTRGEIYTSGIVTRPLQQPNALDRLHAMNKALADYGASVQSKSANPSAFKPLVPMPGNSANPDDTSVCWKPTQ